MLLITDFQENSPFLFYITIIVFILGIAIWLGYSIELKSLSSIGLFISFIIIYLVFTDILTEIWLGSAIILLIIIIYYNINIGGNSIENF